MVSMIASPEFRARRRRSAMLFAGGIGGLMASYAAVLAIAFIATRAS